MHFPSQQRSTPRSQRWTFWMPLWCVIMTRGNRVGKIKNYTIAARKNWRSCRIAFASLDDQKKFVSGRMRCELSVEKAPCGALVLILLPYRALARIELKASARDCVSYTAIWQSARVIARFVQSWSLPIFAIRSLELLYMRITHSHDSLR